MRRTAMKRIHTLFVQRHNVFHILDVYMCLMQLISSPSQPCWKLLSTGDHETTSMSSRPLRINIARNRIDCTRGADPVLCTQRPCCPFAVSTELSKRHGVHGWYILKCDQSYIPKWM